MDLESRARNSFSNPVFTRKKLRATCKRPSTFTKRFSEIFRKTALWPPKPSFIPASVTKKWESRIILVSAKDGSERIVKEVIGVGGIGSIALSPDGRFVLYELRYSANYQKKDIWLISTDGSHEVALVKNPASDHSPFWTPDGKRIVFFSDRSGATALWTLQVKNGKAEGIPEILKQDMEKTRLLGFSQDGTFFLWTKKTFHDIFTADIDFETWNVKKQPAKLPKGFEGVYTKPVWSPDGKFLAYQKNSKPSQVDSPLTLIIHDPRTGDERELATEITTPGGLFRNVHRWSPDGRFLLRAGSKAEHTRGFFLIDVQTGKAAPVLRTAENGKEMIIAGFQDFFPDGERIFYIGGGGTKILECRLDTGEEKTLYQGEMIIASPTILPDGRTIAFRSNYASPDQVIWTMPASGGKARNLFELPKDEHIYTELHWTRDSSHIIFCRTKRTHQGTKESGEMQFWRIPSSGGKPERLGLTLNTSSANFSVHPDGKRVAFQETKGGIDIWALENFLPKPKGKR